MRPPPFRAPHRGRCCDRALIALAGIVALAAGAPLAGQEAATDLDPVDAREFPTSQERTDRDAHDPAAGAGAQDFYFGRPSISLGARVGFFRPRARSEFHDFLVDRFTVGRDDFTSPVLGVDAGLWVSDHVEVTLSVDGGSTTTTSEYRLWVEETPQGDLPIRQTTRLAIGPIFAVGLELHPFGRGEAISRFAWVPRTFSPFVSAGAGGARFDLEQWGDWVVEDTGAIITEEYRADGTGLVGYVGAGVELLLRPGLSFVLEGRYFEGDAAMGGDFRAFEPLDMSGLRLTAGLAYTWRTR